MAVFANAAGEYLSRVTGVVAASSDYTCVFWWKPTTIASIAPFTTTNGIGVYTQYAAIYHDTGVYDLWVSDGGSTLTTASVLLSANTWVAFAYVRAGTAHRFYANGVLVGSVTLDVSAATFSQTTLIDDSFNTSASTTQNFREWSNDLTLAELLDEWNSDTPMRTTDLVTNTSLATNYTDTTANANNWTAVGSTSFVTSAVPKDTTNLSAATAHAVNLTDTYIQIPKEVTGVAQDSWWVYAPAATERAVSAFLFSDIIKTYQPTNTTFRGSPSALTLTIVSVVNKALQVPIPNASLSYFVRCTSASIVDAALNVSWRAAPTNTAIAGSILVNDDTPDYFPAVIISSATGQVLQFLPMVAGEQGDILPTGEVLLEDVNASRYVLYSSQLQQVLSVSFGTVGGFYIRTQNVLGVWYIGRAGVGGVFATVTTVSSAGVLGATTWTLTSAGLLALSASNDGQILYYSGGGGSGAVQRWDLVGNMAMADLVAAIATYVITDILVQSDGTLIVSYWKQSVTTDCLVKHYSAAGAVLNTYTIGETDTQNKPRLASAITATEFWVMWSLPLAQDNFGRLSRIRTVDGVVLTDLTNVEYSAGVYRSPETVILPSRFGRSPSCPFVILRTMQSVVSATTETLTMRRLRRAPHLSTEQLWNFYAMFQLDLETGVGLTSGQGSDPQIMLRYSDDGGHTWSNEIWVSAGALGQYARRAVWRRLGRSRDRVFEITYSEPTKFALVNAYLDVTGGTS